MGFGLFFILSIFLIEFSGFGIICLNNFIQEYEKSKKSILITVFLLLIIIALWIVLIYHSPFFRV